MKYTLKKCKENISYKKILLYNYIDYERAKEALRSNKQAECALIGTPSYGNLGDQLIAFAELEYLKSIYGKDNVIEISENDVRYRFNQVKRCIRKDMFIYLQGGGNISDIWVDQEKIRKRIIKTFHNNIIVFPQSVFFSDKMAEQTILNKYKHNVVVCAREKFTYEVLKRNNITTYLCPDMGFYLKKYYEQEFKNQKRHGIAVCIRNDCEKSYTNAEKQITDFLEYNNYEYEAFTTVLTQYIKKEERKIRIEEMLHYISEKELVITDRLHAMVMAYITNTPCLALANENKKVEGSYKWIKNTQNIYFTKDLDEGLKHIKQLVSKKNDNGFNYFENYQKITDFL